MVRFFDFVLQLSETFMQIPAPSVDEDEDDEETTILATHHLWFPGFFLLGYTIITNNSLFSNFIYLS